MARSGVPRGEDHALQQMLGTQQDQIAQLFRLQVGKEGGGSVKAPFTIGGLTLDADALARLREALYPMANDFEAEFEQGVTTNIAATKRWDEYYVLGDLVFWNFSYRITGTGTAGSELKMTMPVPPFREGSMELGMVLVYDAAPGVRYNTMGEVRNLADLSAGMAFGSPGATGALWGVDPNLALASGDIIRGTLLYRHGLR